MTFFTKLKIRIIKLFIVPCQRATYLMAKQTLTKLSMRERMQLRMHMWKCGWCQDYDTEHQLLDTVLSKMKQDVELSKYYFSMTPEQKQKITEAIKLNVR